MKTLIDKKLFQEKFLLHLFTNPYVIYPFAAGALGVFASWVLNLEPKILYLFASAVIGIGLPIGALITKWTTGTDDIAKRVHEEILHEAQQKQEQELNALHEQLEKDGDKRTEQMLEELRALHQSFQEEARDAGWMATLPITVSAEITGKVTELFYASRSVFERYVENARKIKRFTISNCQTGVTATQRTTDSGCSTNNCSTFTPLCPRAYAQS